MKFEEGAMLLSNSCKIWLYPEVVDFRKQLNGLIVLIVNVLGKDPGSGELFIFRNRAGNTLKMVYFDGLSFWLHYCRLEKGRFKLPKPCDSVFSMSFNQFQWLASGIDFMKKKVKKPRKIKHYF